MTEQAGVFDVELADIDPSDYEWENGERLPLPVDDIYVIGAQMPAEVERRKQLQADAALKKAGIAAAVILAAFIFWPKKSKS